MLVSIAKMALMIITVAVFLNGYKAAPNTKQDMRYIVSIAIITFRCPTISGVIALR